MCHKTIKRKNAKATSHEVVEKAGCSSACYLPSALALILANTSLISPVRAWRMFNGLVGGLGPGGPGGPWGDCDCGGAP